jgi:hypothetical protein
MLISMQVLSDLSIVNYNAPKTYSCECLQLLCYNLYTYATSAKVVKYSVTGYLVSFGSSIQMFYS